MKLDLVTPIQHHLLEWYRAVKRDLPWRRTKDPYHIWVSEVMLQQTQVDTVIPYYERFTDRFPTMEDLAYAKEEEVLKLWEGLGYYSRARNLQSGVREVVESYESMLPKDRSKIMKIKGIGPYTSGAILSIAFNLPEPAVDGNVMRVLSRLFMIDEDIAKPKSRQIFEEVLYSLIPKEEASDFNQALMELGALICKPRQPNCQECPLKEECQAHAGNVQLQFPIKTRKVKKSSISYQVLVVKDDQDKFLVHQRPEEGLLASLWEFPMVQLNLDSNKNELINYMKEQFKITEPLAIKKYSQAVTHVFSHLKWDLNVWQVEINGNANEINLPFKWVFEEELEQLPFPVAHQNVWKLYSASRG